MLLGSMFQSRGAQTEKALSPDYFNFDCYDTRSVEY